MSQDCIFKTVSLTKSPLVSGTKVTCLFKSKLSLSLTGFKEYLSLSSSFFTLPRCDNKIILQLLSKQ